MEVAEISLAYRFLVQVAQRDVESHGAVAQGDGIELAWRDFKARIEVHGPFDDVSFAARLRLCHRFLRAGEYPFLVRIPGGLALARLAFEQTARAHSAFAGFRE